MQPSILWLETNHVHQPARITSGMHCIRYGTSVVLRRHLSLSELVYYFFFLVATALSQPVIDLIGLALTSLQGGPLQS